MRIEKSQILVKFSKKLKNFENRVGLYCQYLEISKKYKKLEIPSKVEMNQKLGNLAVVYSHEGI